MGTPTSSLDLAARIKDGDEAAFSRLFEKYRGRLAVLIHYKLGEELRASVEIDDLLQETFLRAWRDIAGFDYRGPGSLFRWLATVAGHAVADAARTAGRQKRHADLTRFRSAGNPDGPEPADTGTPSRLLAQQQGVEALIRSLDELPEAYRDAIILAKIEGLTTAEVAERLGKSREAAALLLHRAVKRFRELRARD